MALGFEDARLNLQITDGIKWVQDCPEGTYDAIIVDSSDPVGPAEVLFQQVCRRPPLSYIAPQLIRPFTASAQDFRVSWLDRPCDGQTCVCQCTAH